MKPKVIGVEYLAFAVTSTVANAMPQKVHAGWTGLEQNTGDRLEYRFESGAL